MRIGYECFKDSQIKSIIRSLNQMGTCDVTGEENTFIFDTECQTDSNDLRTNILGILESYAPEEELPGSFPEKYLGPIEDFLYNDWSIFNVDKTSIKQIVLALCGDEYSEVSDKFRKKVGLKVLSDSDYLNDNCITRKYSWEDFTESIKHSNRFHSNHVNLELLKKLFSTSDLQLNIKAGESHFYRSRISNGITLSKDEMGPPPQDKATAGRVNSQYISCLYLSNNEITTIHEIRARFSDDITIGRFKAKQQVKLIDLSKLDELSPFSGDNTFIEWYAINMAVLKSISKDIAKPLRSQDSEIDYLPSQYIADYIKSLGYDGICFKSTLYKDGLNYAIFDEKKFECFDINRKHVSEVKYRIE